MRVMRVNVDSNRQVVRSRYRVPAWTHISGYETARGRKTPRVRRPLREIERGCANYIPASPTLPPAADAMSEYPGYQIVSTIWNGFFRYRNLRPVPQELRTGASDAVPKADVKEPTRDDVVAVMERFSYFRIDAERLVPRGAAVARGSLSSPRTGSTRTTAPTSRSSSRVSPPKKSRPTAASTNLSSWPRTSSLTVSS